MSWCSIREFTQRNNLSFSTVRRHIQQGKIQARKFGRNWYIEYPDHYDSSESQKPVAPKATQGEAYSAGMPSFEVSKPTVSDGGLQSVVEFSSKALNHYLMMHEKLMEEKEVRLQEKEAVLIERRQEVAELEGYVKILEEEIARLKDRPEGWR